LVALGLVATLALACGGDSGGNSPDGGGNGGASAGTGGPGTGGGTAGAGPGGGAGAGGPGGGSVPATSGVAGTKRLDALNMTEKQMFCDWTALHFGGYGMSITCPDGVTTLDADPSRADCVSAFPTMCAVTVAQGEQCTKDSSCTDPIPASCAGLFNCQ
jgi:hypothetical protein